MKRLALLLCCLSALLSALAIGTRKATQHIYVRYELVAPGTAAAPQERHNDKTGYHSLLCRSATPTRCGWRRRPRLATAVPNLDSLERMIFRLIRSGAAQGTYELGGVGFYFRRFANGYEYLVLEGPDVTGQINAWIDESERRSASPKHIRPVMR